MISATPVTLVDNDALSLVVFPRDSGQLCFCFTGVGHNVGGIDIQTNEFFAATRQSMVVFVCDKQRSWGNSLDFDRIAEFTAPYAAGKRLTALGNSMGGFLAILASRFIAFDTVVSICPQYSVCPQVIDEPRWRQYTSKITDWKYPSLDGAFLANTQYYAFGSPYGRDWQQLQRFPVLPNLHKIMLRGVEAHHEARRMKQFGVLYPVIEACFEQAAAPYIVERYLTNPELDGGLIE